VQRTLRQANRGQRTTSRLKALLGWPLPGFSSDPNIALNLLKFSASRRTA
jgi:hypothetical protein